jgi:hypothetical protein
MPASIKFNLPVEQSAALQGEAWAYMELESLLIMCDALSDNVQTADAASMLLRSSSSLSSAAAASVVATASSSSSLLTASATAAAATTTTSSSSSDTDVLSACLTLCSFSDRDIAYHALMLLQSIVRHPRVSTAFMDRRGLDIVLPLALPPQAAGAGAAGTFFTGPVCSLMLRFGVWGLRFAVCGLGFGVWGLGFGFWFFGFNVGVCSR